MDADRRAALEARMEELGGELRQAREEYRRLTGWGRLGPHLAVGLGGGRVLVAAEDVEEVVPMVRLISIPRAPAEVLGSFVHRGVFAIALDAAPLFGHRSARGGDFLVVLAGVPRTAFAVEDLQGVAAAAEVSYRAAVDSAGAGGVIAAMVADGDTAVVNAEALRAIARRAGGAHS